MVTIISLKGREGLYPGDLKKKGEFFLFTRRRAYKWRGCLQAAVYVIQNLSFFRLVCMNLIQSSFLFRLLPVIPPDPDLEMGGGGGLNTVMKGEMLTNKGR